MNVGGKMYRLNRIAGMPRAARLEAFPSAAERRAVCVAFAARKLGALRKGVTWQRITGCRICRSQFAGVKKRQMRVLAGDFVKKNSSVKDSLMVRAKLAVHMALTGKPIANWAGVEAWLKTRAEKGVAEGVVAEEDARLLVQTHGRKSMAPRERRLLTWECLASAR